MIGTDLGDDGEIAPQGTNLGWSSFHWNLFRLWESLRSALHPAVRLTGQTGGTRIVALPGRR